MNKIRTTMLNFKFSLSVFTFTFLLFTFVGLPLSVSAVDWSKAIVPCGYDDARGGDNNDTLDPIEHCTFNDFVQMAGRIVNGIIIFISAYAAVSFMYAGYAYLTSGGNQEKVSYAKQLFWKVFLGYIIILGAWAFIYMIEQALYTDDAKARPDSFLNSGTPTPRNP